MAANYETRSSLASCAVVNASLPTIVENLPAVGGLVFLSSRSGTLAGVLPPEVGSAPDTLAIPGDPEDVSTMDLPECAVAAWLITHIRSAEDIVLARIPHGLATTQLPVSSRSRSNTDDRKPNTSQLTEVGPVAFALRTFVEKVKIVWQHTSFVVASLWPDNLDDPPGIIRTNSFLVPVIISEPPVICCPNAMFRWDKDTFSGEIRAMRPISEGEDLIVSYFQEILEPGYNFKCTYLICARSSKARARSDDGRPITSMSVTDIGAYYRETLNYLHTIEAALDREMIVYPTHWIYLARVIVMVHCALREAKAAHKWARRAAQHPRALTGLDGGWDRIARELERCGWWGTWNKPRLRGIWV
ncbi:hypothetical protein BJY52DRAFT_1418062 [Lactarius psammicola]|nr:hypothetical protein BJY52DRAFT_1418062 [Lactarius psammicola]